MTASIDGVTPLRDYVMDEDVCRVALASLRVAIGRAPLVLNLCSGVGTSVEQMIAEAERALGRPIRVRIRAATTPENAFMVGNPDRLRQQLGSVPLNRVSEFWRRMLGSPAAGLGSPQNAGVAPGRQ